jgi:hypothetical protein
VAAGRQNEARKRRTELNLSQSALRVTVGGSCPHSNVLSVSDGPVETFPEWELGLPTGKLSCQGIVGNPVERPGRHVGQQFDRWVSKATVYKSPRSHGFVGYGDADPTNVSSLVHGAEMRVAETRAVNRALRKAYGIGLCSLEELGWSPYRFGREPGRTPNASPDPASGMKTPPDTNIEAKPSHS